MNFTFVAPSKAPAASLAYQLDLTAWIRDASVSSFSLSVDDPALQLSDEAESAGIISFRARGGEHGSDYYVNVAWTTSDGDEDNRTIRIPVLYR